MQHRGSARGCSASSAASSTAGSCLSAAEQCAAALGAGIRWCWGGAVGQAAAGAGGFPAGDVLQSFLRVWGEHGLVKLVL